MKYVLLLSTALVVSGSAIAAGHPLPKNATPTAVTITEFDVPKAEGYTGATSINSSGQVAGLYVNGYAERGFIRSADGSNYTTFPVKGGTASLNVTSINKLGWVVGSTYSGSSFLRKPSGKVQLFQPQGAVASWPSVINLHQEIAGTWEDANYVNHGFLRKPTGEIQIIDVSGAASTEVYALNGGGAFAGSFQNSSGFHGFIEDADGTFITCDPNLSVGSTVLALNTAGVATGNWTQYGHVSKDGFVRATDGTITSFDAEQGADTTPTGISESGVVVGYATDGNQETIGFLRTPNGAITLVQAPGASTAGQGAGTVINAISGRRFVGTYVDADDNYHGFVGTF